MKPMSPGQRVARMNHEMVAPCGMNCNLCSRVLDPAKPGSSGRYPRCDRRLQAGR